MSLKHHHMMPVVIMWCSDDIMLFLVRMSAHVPGQLSGSIHSEWRCWSRCSNLFWWEENCGPRHIPWHSPPGTSTHPCAKSARIQFIKNILKTYLIIGMQKHLVNILASLTIYNFIFSQYQSSACSTLAGIIQNCCQIQCLIQCRDFTVYFWVIVYSVVSH